MFTRFSLAIPALICALALTSAGVRADEEDGVPSLKKNTKRETKEVVTKVAEAIVKAARAKPSKMELDKYEYTSPKEGRTELKMTVKWAGSLTGTKVTSTIVVLIDSSNKEAWEVLNIKYEDDNKLSLAKPNTKKIQDLIPMLNK
jgi:phenylpyruvate tautomerase PptA (4-oxalocrotonate tautomerase family)